MGRNDQISKFSNSLKDFLINTFASKLEDAKTYIYKYNNLKVFMDPMKYTTPHFFVQIGISEACFAIKDGSKIDGSVGNEDPYVKRWAGRYNIQKELESHWKLLQEAIRELSKDGSLNASNAAREKLKRAEKSEETFDEVDMTSTGISKATRFLAQERERKLKKYKKFLKQRELEKQKRGNKA